MAGDRLPRPQLHGFLERATKKRLIGAFSLAATGCTLYYVLYVRRRQNAYMEYHRTADPYKDFEQMRKLGVFDSCNLFPIALAGYNPYGFIAYLYNIKHNTSLCTGAIISPYYILNFCLYGSFRYDAVIVGVKSTQSVFQPDPKSYRLCGRKVHPDFELLDGFREAEKKEPGCCTNLFTTRNAIFLDRTSTKMDLDPKRGIWAITVSRDQYLPQTGLVHYFKEYQSEEDITSLRKTLTVLDTVHCDKYYEKHQLRLDPDTEFCADSTRVRQNECCRNHALMEHDNKLIGVMSWSTQCSDPPEPWVFTRISHYMYWISDFLNEQQVQENTKR